MDKIESIELRVGHIAGVVVTPIIEQVIEIARQVRSTGKSKVDAVRQIYPKIADCPKEAIWYAIIHGVNLSSRGAVTEVSLLLRR